MGLKRFFRRIISFLTGTNLQDKDFTDKQQGYLLNKDSNIQPIPVIYGERKIGGTRVFVSTSGSTNQYLYVILVLCEGEIKAIDDIYIDDVISTDARFGSLITVNKYLGTDNQTADTLFVNADIGWTTDHKLSGLAYLAVRFAFNTDAFGSGIPKITAVVRGKKVYDPRITSTVYSDNPALCLRDYLTNTRYGKGIATSLINDTQFTTSANYCDATVTKYTGAGSDTKLFECNAIIDTSETLFNNVKVLLSGMRGMLPFQGGQYGLIIDGDPSSTFAFTQSNMLSGITISSINKNNKYNQVVAKFINPDTNWQSDSVTYPELGSSDDSTYLAEDSDIRLSTEITLAITTDSYVARDLARVALLSSRTQGLQVTFTGTSEALQCAIGDVVTITHETPAWTDKEFKVLSIELLDSGEVNITAQEHDGNIYSYETNAVIQPVVQSALPNPFAIAAPTNLVVTETSILSNDGTIVPALQFTWTASADSFVTSYETQYIGSTLFDWGSITEAAGSSENWGAITSASTEQENYGAISETIPTGAPYYESSFVNTTQYILTGIATNVEFSFRVRGINEIGVKSAWVSISATAVGDTDPPALPTSLSVTGGLQTLTVAWVNPTETDFSHVEIFESSSNSFASSVLIGKSASSNFVSSGYGYGVTRYFWLKSVDFSGNKSVQTSSVSGATAFVDVPSFTTEVLDLFNEAGAFGIQPVDSLPASGDFDGQIVYLTTDSTMYVWLAATSEWSDEIYTSSAVAGGSVTAASFASGIEPISVVDTLPSPTGYTGPKTLVLTTDAKIYRYDSSVPEFTTLIKAIDLDGALADVNFPTNLRPIEIVTSLPTTGNFAGRQVFLTTDDKLYRHTGSAWTAAVATSDLSGTIGTGQIADSAISAVKIADDAVTNAKIAVDAIQGDVIAAGAITATKIGDNSISTAKIQANAITANEINAGTITATELAAGSVTTAKLSASAVTADKITSGAITAVKISSGAITSDKIEAGAITSATIASGAITSDKITAGAITSGAIAAGAITAGKIASGAIVAGTIAAGAITATELAADAVTAGKIAAGAISTDALQANVITTDKLAANSVTAGIIAASGVITFAAQITNGIIENAKIANGAITTAKIGTAQVDTLQVAGNAVTVPTSAYTTGNIVINADPELPPSGVTVTVQSAAATLVVSQPVFLRGSVRAILSSGSAHTGVTLELYRGTTLLISRGPINGTSSNTYDLFVDYVDSGMSAGSNTYYLKIKFNPSGSFMADVCTVSNRLIYAIQTKR